MSWTSQWLLESPLSCQHCVVRLNISLLYAGCAHGHKTETGDQLIQTQAADRMKCVQKLQLAY